MSNMKQIIISVDLEHDIARPKKYLGVENAIIPLLEILKNEGIKADFFALSEIIENYAPIMHKIIESGHSVGSHGHLHRMMCKEKYDTQLHEISQSKSIIENELNIEVKMFRAPNFSVNGNTIRALEAAGYTIDSSVLPGRAPMKWKMFPVHYDFRSAPVHPYYPSVDDVSKEGNSNILEIPITQNPRAKGQPIGMGYLNLHGVNAAIKAIDDAEGNPIMFLIHPWEMIDIGECYPSIKESWKKICSDNHEIFSELLTELKKKGYTFTTIQETERKIRSEK